MVILAIPGSLRRRSFNRMLLEAAVECAPEGMNIAIAGLEGIPVFSEDLEAAGEPEAVVVLRGRVERAEGLLIATPEYNQSIPGGLKNAIDWLSRREEVLVRKPVCIVGATAGPWGTRLAQAALRQVLGATESLVMPARGRKPLRLRPARRRAGARRAPGRSLRLCGVDSVRNDRRWPTLLPVSSWWLTTRTPVLARTRRPERGVHDQDGAGAQRPAGVDRSRARLASATAPDYLQVGGIGTLPGPCALPSP